MADLAGGLFSFAFLSLEAGSKPRRRRRHTTAALLPPSLCRGHLVPFLHTKQVFRRNNRSRDSLAFIVSYPSFSRKSSTYGESSAV